jgi:hypothetical protein
MRLEPFPSSGCSDIHDAGLHAGRFFRARRACSLEPEPEIRWASLPAGAERFMMIAGGAESESPQWPIMQSDS